MRVVAHTHATGKYKISVKNINISVIYNRYILKNKMYAILFNIQLKISHLATIRFFQHVSLATSDFCFVRVYLSCFYEDYVSYYITNNYK